MELCGTYRLISSSRRIVETGQEVDAFGKNAKGLIMYGEDGHFLALVTNDGRPKPESIGTMSDQQRADLHHIDLSWNEVWTGTTVIRDVKIEGDRAIYTSRPAPYGGDGKMSVVTLVWEKVK